MRICIVTPHFPSRQIPYNEGMFLLREAKQLSKRGHRFFIVTCRQHGFPKFEIVDGIPVYRVSCIMIPNIRYPIPNLFQLTNTIIRVIKKYRIELLDFWNHEYLTTLPVVFLRKIVKVPITVSVGGLPGINWFYGEKIVDFIGLTHSLFIAKLILMRADGIRLEFYSLSEVLSRLGIPNNKIHTVKRGVHTKVFRLRKNGEKKKTELGINKGNVVILYVGRLEKIKGLEYLVETAKQLLKEYNHLTFVFAGEGTLRQKYEEMTRSIRENVMFLGFRSDVYQLMNAADIFVLPSRSEAHPISVLEAKACGLPVIASKVGGVPEIVRDGVNGRCVKPKSVEKLTEALRELIDNPSLAKKMGKKGRIFVKQHFSEEVVTNNVEKYYQKLVSLHIGGNKKRGDL